MTTELDSQADRQRGAVAWLRRVLVGFGVLFLLTVAVIVLVSLGVHFLPTQGPTSAVEIRHSTKL